LKLQVQVTWGSWQAYCMRKNNNETLCVTGLGVTSAIGQGQIDFSNALLHGEHRFDYMSRPGRQIIASDSNDDGEKKSAFIGAEIASLSIPDKIPTSLIRTSSLSGQVALTTLFEAWEDADLENINPDRIGLIIGGSNFQQRELVNIHRQYHNRTHFLRPSYGISFMDSDLCGLCTEMFDIRGFAYTLGGASASGQLAVIQAAQSVQAGLVDVAIAVGALMDLSYWECQSFRSIGAMGTDRFGNQPEAACRPFDTQRDGFIFGESCGAVVIENRKVTKRKSMPKYAELTGWGVSMDGNRNPNPSREGEIKVIEMALKKAKCNPGKIDYINPHGTGSLIGDETELEALGHCGLRNAYLNASKSILGHGLSAAGTVELIATLIQMKAKQLHPTRNLNTPIDESFNWIRRDKYSSLPS